jgi:hypothetical protein
MRLRAIELEGAKQMPRNLRHASYSGKQFICGMALSLAALYALCVVSKTGIAPSRQGANAPLYVTDPYQYGTSPFVAHAAVSRARELNHRAYLAAREGRIDQIRRLVHAGMSVDRNLGKAETPLIVACKYGRLELARWLIARHANINAIDGDGGTALSAAAANGRTAVVRYLHGLSADRDIAGIRANHAPTTVEAGGAARPPRAKAPRPQPTSEVAGSLVHTSRAPRV